MESMLKELQTSQIYKFNHVLESNYKRFETVKKELMGKENEMEAVRCELKEKNGLVDRQK